MEQETTLPDETSQPEEAEYQAVVMQQDPAMFQQMITQESQQQPYQNMDGQQQPQGMP